MGKSPLPASYPRAGSIQPSTSVPSGLWKMRFSGSERSSSASSAAFTSLSRVSAAPEGGAT